MAGEATASLAGSQAVSKATAGAASGPTDSKGAYLLLLIEMKQQGSVTSVSSERLAQMDTSEGMGQARDTRVHVTQCSKLDKLTSVPPQLLCC